MGFLSGFKENAGKDTGNPFAGSAEDNARLRDATQNLLKYKGSNAALDPLQSSRIATQEVQSNPILSQLFGSGGTFGRTAEEEQGLASRGFSLQPEDHEAYGQMSGQLARDFDKSEQGLAQALANRGLSQSGAANRAFTTSQGNKMEQLAGLQRKIANDRMQMNMQRLAQTRNFLSSLGQQGQNAIQDQYGRQMGSEKERFGQEQAKADAGYRMLNGMAQQSNENLSQRQATKSGGLGGAFSRGIMGGIEAAPTMAMQMGAKAMSGGVL